jgi:hypothetical protein
MSDDAFTVRQVGTTGHEIRDRDGNVIAWTVDSVWATIIAGQLNRVEAERVSAGPSSNAAGIDKV